MEAIWSGMMTGTIVSQLAKNANHKSDTAIWSVTGNRPDSKTPDGWICCVEAATRDSSIMPPALL